jgi:iron(III) transport system ATP-binding protein
MTMASVRGRAASVEFAGVRKSYGGGRPAVRDVSFRIEPGTLVTLLGPSGCGKTTTLRLIAGLEKPDAGRILIDGADVTLLPASERDVAMVFQSYALFPHMSVRANVEYGLRFSGVAKREIAERANAGLELVGLAGFGDRYPSQLSGGQQQRVAVARAIVLEPRVLLFDEPLSNLDARLRRRVREEIRDLQQRLGLTVAYVTHDQEEALAVSDRIIVMNEAVIAQQGAPRDLYDAPANAFVADFIGEANLLGCEIVAAKRGIANVRIGRIKLSLPGRGLAPGPAKLALRPGRIGISRKPAKNSLPGILMKAVYVGRGMECRIATDAGEVFAIAPDTRTPLVEGDRVHLRLADAHPVLVKD